MFTRPTVAPACLAAAVLAGTLLMALPGCDALAYYQGRSDDQWFGPSGSGPASGDVRGTVVNSGGPVQVIGQPAPGQQLFATDQEAVSALLDAAKVQDQAALSRVLGPAADDLISSGDPVEDQRAAASFAEHAAESTRLEKKDSRINPQTTILHVGEKDWPMPIPVVQTAEGKWFFDTAAGRQEVLARRVGHNELETIKVCHAYVQAQREYAAKDRDGSEVLQYAQRMVSHPGQKDGLYWEAAPGEEQSPLGPLIAQATEEGYSTHAGHRQEPFFGYYYRIIKQQGSAAPGGEYSYIINGRMIAGFALVAWPANYGSTGVMTFIISHQGKLYQKDLGAGTDAAARAMGKYNPDRSWSVVKD